MVSFVQNLEKFDDIGVLPEYQIDCFLYTQCITHLSTIFIRRPVETQNKGSIMGRCCDRSRVHDSRIHLYGRSSALVVTLYMRAGQRARQAPTSSNLGRGNMP